MREYVIELRSILYRLHVLAAYALNLKHNHFEEFMIDDVLNGYIPNLCLRLNYYFELDQDHNFEDAARIGAHSDYRGFTLLYIDDVEGLQAQIEGKWIDIKQKEDAFIVNAGDFIQIWTMNRWKAAKHRVMPTTHKERVSLSYFSGPRDNVVIQPFPDCNVCRKTAGQHSTEKLFFGTFKLLL